MHRLRWKRHHRQGEEIPLLSMTQVITTTTTNGDDDVRHQLRAHHVKRHLIFSVLAVLFQMAYMILIPVTVYASIHTMSDGSWLFKSIFLHVLIVLMIFVACISRLLLQQHTIMLPLFELLSGVEKTASMRIGYIFSVPALFADVLYALHMFMSHPYHNSP